MGFPSIIRSSIFLSLCGNKLGENHSWELQREIAEQRANRIIAEELARRSWQETENNPWQRIATTAVRPDSTLSNATMLVSILEPPGGALEGQE
jgi:hypothetical protein